MRWGGANRCGDLSRCELGPAVGVCLDSAKGLRRTPLCRVCVLVNTWWPALRKSTSGREPPWVSDGPSRTCGPAGGWLRFLLHYVMVALAVVSPVPFSPTRRCHVKLKPSSLVRTNKNTFTMVAPKKNSTKSTRLAPFFLPPPPSLFYFLRKR